VLDPEICKDRNCIIIDDICDGGGTFNLIASQIQPDHLTLMVTHGLFTKGFKQLNQNFHEIVTTDSYGHTWPNEKRVTQYKLSSLC
jgi:ribose-phosphate pyrophosphokinase